MQNHKPRGRFVPTRQNQAGLLAIQELISALRSGRACEGTPLFLHGPTGTGKSHLVRMLVADVSRASSLIASVIDTGQLERPVAENAGEPWESAAACDLVVIEDVQHLPPWARQPFAEFIDVRVSCRQALVLTSNVGPQHLEYRGERWPNRLTSRLAAGLVVGLEPLRTSDRRLLLEELAQSRQLALAQDVLSWLAEHLTGGGRHLEGAINQLEQLARTSRQPLSVALVSGLLREQAEAGRPSVERIVQRVSGYFRVEARQLQSRRRYRNILLPRQVGMYLARRLTRLPLDQIGAYFGGRDHSTVLHACRKIEETMQEDAVLSGAVRQLHAELA